jgi:hypothetical protein
LSSGTFYSTYLQLSSVSRGYLLHLCGADTPATETKKGLVIVKWEDNIKMHLIEIGYEDVD